MNVGLERLQSRWETLRAEWEASSRLRLGIWAVLGILCLNAVLMGLDKVDAQKARLQEMEAEIARSRGASAEQSWARRAKDAEEQLAALSSMAWAEADPGLSEAAFQDWIRNVSARLGLKTRELVTSRVEDVRTDGAGPRSMAPLPPGAVLMRARLVVDLQRAPLMSFLAEAARNERSVVVSRLILRANAQPPLAEIEMQALARRPEVKQ